MKDPAVLLYVNDWLNSTAAMEADCRGWYLNLILHNYDKGSLPSDIETLAVLCNVKYSEFERFKQVFEQVLKQKFEHNEDGTISNARTQKILQARETFKDKRTEAGRKSYLIRFFKKKYPNQYKIKDLKEFVLENIDTSIDLKDEQNLEQVFEQMFELYRNENENENENEDKNIEKRFFDEFNQKCTRLSKVQILNQPRKTKISARISDFGAERAFSVIDAVAASNFLNGENDRNWKASFDWILEPGNFTKILEGNYNNDHGKSTNHNSNNGYTASSGNTAGSKNGKISARQFLAREFKDQFTGSGESGNITIDAEVVE